MNKLLTAILLFVSLCIQAQNLETISVNGNSRTMMVYEPKELPQNAPLVISLHGANQDAAYQRDQTKWNNCADTAKIVVVYPNAINKFWDTSGTSDIKFLETIIDLMYERFHIDKNRVYISGFSLGAMMTYHCMEHLGNKVAAFGPVSGVRFDNRAPVAPRRVPFIHTHGTGDDVFKWTGDPGHAAGGYPYIPDYVQKWATYEQLDVKEEIAPYPKNFPNSIATLTKWRSSDPNDTIEIALLALKDKGHWHSEDIASGVSTTQEIWRFCKRYSLGPAEPIAPTLKKVEPEDMSFDLPLTQRTFVFTFDGQADYSKVKATLTGEGMNVDLVLAEEENSNILTFSVPESTELKEGDYKLKVTNVMNPEGGQPIALNVSYTYGFTEVGEEIQADTLLLQNWSAMEEAIGEGIPYGWKRVNSDANGTNDTKESGAANTGGARLKYFHEGGDFSTGFYFSAREYENCTFTYGLYDEYPLQMKPGKYELKFRSAYWSEGSQSNAATFSVNIAPLSDSSTKVFSEDGLLSSGCLNERTDVRVSNTMQHDYAVNIESENKYLLSFSMNQGWNSVILADIQLITYPSAADIYKGGLLRMMKRAKELYALTEGVELLSISNARSRLKTYIDKYENLVSTAPSVYTKAMNNLQKNMTILENYLATAGISTVISEDSNRTTQYFTVDGRRISVPQKGITIVRETNGNGDVKSRKIYR